MPKTKEEKAVQGGIAAASVATVGATAGVTSAVGIKQQQGVDRSLWDHILQRDTPLNQMPIIEAHNAGDPGHGTVFFAQNQNMSTAELLDQTPVRALEFKVYEHNGQLVLNHGGLFDPTASSEVTLADEADTVSAWIDNPQNSHEVVILEVGGYYLSDPQDKWAVMETLKEKFGDKIYTDQDFYADLAHSTYLDAEGHPRWPTVNELAERGKNIVILSENLPSDGIGISGSQVIVDPWHQGGSNLDPSLLFTRSSEDRTAIGYLGDQLHPEIVAPTNTAEADALIQRGGIISMDQITPNDPRFIKPEDRSKMDLDPDVTLFKAWHINRGALSSTVFGFGLMSDLASTSFGFLSGIYQAYTNAQYIQDCEVYLKKAIQDLSSDEIKKIGEDAEKIKVLCTNKLISTINQKTLKAGLLTTLSIATGIFGLGTLFPSIFFITSLLCLAIISLGIISTLIATYINRKKLILKIETIERSKINEMITSKIKSMSSIELDGNPILEKDKKHNKRLEKITEILFVNSLISNISSITKYSISLIGKIASFLVGLGSILGGIVQGLLHHRHLKSQRKKIHQLISGIILPSIDRKPYLFFGKSELEKYVHENFKKIKKETGIQAENRDELIAKLQETKNIRILNTVRMHCIEDNLQKAFGLYLTKKLLFETDSDQDKMINDYIAEKMGGYAYSSTRYAGIINAMKISGGLFMISAFCFPQIAGILGIVAVLGFFLIALPIIYIAARSNKKLFKKATMESLSQNKEGEMAGIIKIKEILQKSLKEQHRSTDKKKPFNPNRDYHLLTRDQNGSSKRTKKKSKLPTSSRFSPSSRGQATGRTKGD